MSYYSLTICFMLSLFNNETKQLVEFREADVVIVKENSYVTIILPFEILSEYQIQSNSDASNGSIPTKITFNEKN